MCTALPWSMLRSMSCALEIPSGSQAGIAGTASKASCTGQYAYWMWNSWKVGKLRGFSMVCCSLVKEIFLPAKSCSRLSSCVKYSTPWVFCVQVVFAYGQHVGKFAHNEMWCMLLLATTATLLATYSFGGKPTSCWAAMQYHALSNEACTGCPNVCARTAATQAASSATLHCPQQRSVSHYQAGYKKYKMEAHVI